MISDEAVEAAARVLDPAIWSLDLPVGTRADTLDFHARRQASCVKARAALEAALPHLLDREKVGAMLDDIDGGLELLRLAVASQDPKAELLYRVKELVADVEHLRTLAHPQKGGEG